MSTDQSTKSYPQPPENPQHTTPPKKNNTWIYLGIIALLLGVNGYLFFNKNKLTKEKEAADIHFAQADSSRAVIQQDYDAALARLDELVSQNATMDSLINNRNSEVARLRSQIDKIINNEKATAADLARAQKLITQLNSKAASYEERINQLEGDNARLTQTNQVLSSERDSAVTRSSELRKLGAVLSVTNIRMRPIDLRKNGEKEKETGRARRVDIFRIIFDIVENRIAESGPKEMFFRVIGPDGNLLSNAAYGSGVTTDHKGESIPYTFSKQINLETAKPVSNITADWKQENDYVKGNYLIEIYNSGYKVGSGGIILK